MIVIRAEALPGVPHLMANLPCLALWTLGEKLLLIVVLTSCIVWKKYLDWL